MPGLANGVVAIAASDSASYVLISGSVYAWGGGGGGQLGDSRSESSPTPVKVMFPAGVSIVAIGEAKNDGYAIDSTGQGWAWGANSKGALCLGGSEGKVTMPEKVPGMTDAVAVQGGGKHVLWLLANGTVETCGTNAHGELGLGSGVSADRVPGAVPGLAHVVEISAGNVSSAARESSGAVYVWGGNEQGQVGIGSETPAVYEPAHVALPGAASEISCGGDLARNGSVLALGSGEGKPELKPVMVDTGASMFSATAENAIDG
ncbi:MAG: hypothetical protein ABSG95_09870 [Solirubrobacteraceae bacterium]